VSTHASGNTTQHHVHEPKMLNVHALVRSSYPSAPSRTYASTFVLSRNTNIVDTCVVFRQWHISSTSSFIFSCLIIVALGVLYEYLRAFQKSFDRRIAASLSGTKGKGRIRLSGSSGSGRSTPESNQEEESGLLNGGGRKIRDG
jgi:hypothetical protein